VLFQVQMTVSLPPSLPTDEVDRLRKAEAERSHALQQAGTIRHLWRIAGRYANVSIFDVTAKTIDKSSEKSPGS